VVGSENAQVSGDGHAELLYDGAIEIVFRYHNGEEPSAKRKK
jgi:hypothetical protein